MRGRLLAVFTAFGLVGALAGCATSPGEPAATRITVDSEHCGVGWSTPHAGQQQFLLANTDIAAAEVFLVNAASGAVYAYVDNLAPGATAMLRLDLGSGKYQFRCALSDEGVAYGKSVTIPGTALAGPPPVKAVTDNDLIPLTKKYDAWVQDQLPGLKREASALSTDIAAGDLAAARAAWLPAHLAYERLGAAYGAFGDADAAINGLPSGLPLGLRDPSFTGFHRVEYGLWHGQPASELAPIARQLAQNIETLGATLNDTSVATLDLGLRCHEITENALQFDLTGQSDFGSGTSLASVSAELAGTAELLKLLHPLLVPRYPELSSAEAALTRAQGDVVASDTNGAWTPLSKLGVTIRERINSDLSGLATLLAPVASITEPRNDS